MDFLDPQKQRRHKIRLITGYVLIGIALLLVTRLLLYQAHGYGTDNKGRIIQNGFVFVSALPKPANIDLNGTRYKSQTNARIQLPAGDYTIKLQRQGYRPWQRLVTVNGGDVQHFDYPLLVPASLTPTPVRQYATAPNLVSQSPDHRWLVVQGSGNFNEFELYDLTKPKPKETPTSFVLPADVLSTSDDAQSWQLLEWSDDNRHLLLKHLYQKAGQSGSEYILVDRQAPLQSLNLTKALNANPAKIALRDNAYDQYYLFDQAAATLTQASLKAPAPVAYLDHVLDFKPYGSNVVLYVSDQAATAGKVSVKLRQGADTYTLRELTPSSAYLIDLDRYSGDWYMVTASTAENKIYVYKNPVDTLHDKPKGPATPLRVLRVAHPTFVAFSENAQFVLAQGGSDFAVYDTEYKRSYAYQIKASLDAPQQHATWMDSYRLFFVSGGKTIMFDYDGANQQTLATADLRFGTIFDPNTKFAYAFTAQQTAATPEKPAIEAFVLISTPLRLPADQ